MHGAFKKSSLIETQSLHYMTSRLPFLENLRACSILDYNKLSTELASRGYWIQRRTMRAQIYAVSVEVAPMAVIGSLQFILRALAPLLNAPRYHLYGASF